MTGRVRIVSLISLSNNAFTQFLLCILLTLDHCLLGIRSTFIPWFGDIFPIAWWWIMLWAHFIGFSATWMNSIVLVTHMSKHFLSGPISFFLRRWLRQSGSWRYLVSCLRTFHSWTFRLCLWMTVLTSSQFKIAGVIESATFVPSERWILPNQFESLLLFYWQWFLLEFTKWMLTKTLIWNRIPLIDINKLHSISHRFIEVVSYYHISMSSRLPNWGTRFLFLCIL